MKIASSPVPDNACKNVAAGGSNADDLDIGKIAGYCAAAVFVVVVVGILCCCCICGDKQGEDKEGKAVAGSTTC